MFSLSSSSLSNTGKVDSVKTVFEWEIDNVCLVKKNVGEVLISPEFLSGNMKWQLKIHPNGRTQEFEGYASIELQSLTLDLKKNELILVMSFVNYYNTTLFSYMECVTFSAENSSWKFDKLLKYEELLSKLNHVSPHNKLKIKCELLHKTSNIANVYIPLNFESYFNSEKHSDVKFILRDQIFHAHKVILSTKSEVFAAMFEHSMKENLENAVNIEDVEYEVFAEMLRFVYTGRVMNIKNNVQNLLIAADKYAIEDLKFICGECLCNTLSNDNVVQYLELADLYEVKALKTKAMDFIMSHAKTLIDVPNFKSIVALRGDLVFEIFRCLVQAENKNSEIRQTSEKTSLAVGGLQFNPPTPNSFTFGFSGTPTTSPSSIFNR